MSRVTQQELVLARLKRGPATSWELQQLGICSHTARVFDLRKVGHVITWVKKRGIVTYTLEGHSTSVPAIPPSMPYVSLQRNGMRKCLNPPCTVVFKPKTKRQFYHSDRCRFQDWERTHPRLNFEQSSTGASV